MSTETSPDMPNVEDDIVIPPSAPVKVEATVNVNSVVPYLVCIVAVFGIGAGAAAYSPSTGGMVMAAAVPILVALMSILQKQSSQDKVLSQTHDAVNSKSDQLLAATRELYRKIGATEGRAAQKEENSIRDNPQ